MFRNKTLPLVLILVVIILTGCSTNSEYKLNISKAEDYTGESTVVIEPNQQGYTQGDKVTLTAYPKDQFKNWNVNNLANKEEQDVYTENPKEFIIDNSKEIIATFSDTTISVQFTKGTSSGGMFGWLGDLMQNLLGLLYNFTKSYGLSIIILTLAIKLILYPLTHKQTSSMKKMQQIQPEIEKLREKYGDNQQKFQEETMKLYQKHKINPLSGCLPMLVQMPILIALFQALRGWGDLAGQSFLIIPDLSQGYMPLVILTGVVTAVQSLLTQNISFDDIKSNPQKVIADNKMALFMPLFIIFIGASLPAGVLLYWFISNLIMVIQQYLISREPDVEFKEESN
ncbi:YidC/Oxa1 family membrane protein insertase [Orenia metallireducens]|nr:YidC/Oxa1 family membrane protein insertase [Orenia metallireducens]